MGQEPGSDQEIAKVDDCRRRRILYTDDNTSSVRWTTTSLSRSWRRATSTVHFGVQRISQVLADPKMQQVKLQMISTNIWNRRRSWLIKRMGRYWYVLLSIICFCIWHLIHSAIVEFREVCLITEQRASALFMLIDLHLRFIIDKKGSVHARYSPRQTPGLFRVP